MSKTNELFNPKDFMSISTKVRFSNLTSRAQPLPPGAVSLLEMDEHEAVLGLPVNCCNVNHSIAFDLEQEDPASGGPPIRFHATSKVLEVEPTDDSKTVRVRVELIQYDESTWRILLERADERQQRVLEFLRASQG